ncbi:LemA family protein [bacterium]|nr:LemA family protein [bacterium]
MDNSLFTITIILLFTICIIYIIVTYNKGIKLRNYVREAFSIMDVYLKKRWDLIPNLIEVVKSYAQHEKELFESISKIRTGDYSSYSYDSKINTNIQLEFILPKIIAVAENYPELKANEHFSKLMSELVDIENDIANSRKYYNGTVRELSNYLEIFPSSVIAAIFGIKGAKMFEISDNERKDVEVNF